MKKLITALLIAIVALAIYLVATLPHKPTAYYLKAKPDGACRMMIIVTDDLDNDIACIDYMDSCDFGMDEILNDLEVQPGWPTPMGASKAYFRLRGF